MSLLRTLSTARDIGRLHEIASVLIRHGFGDVVRRAGAVQAMQRVGRVLRWKSLGDLSRPPEVRVREAFEQLGPTFVKLGQLLAGRSDLLPPAWTKELSRLHQHVTTVPYSELAAAVEEDLGGIPSVHFAAFDPEPLAAGSIAQVHRATLHDGTEVVLKLRRPGIVETVEADLRLMATLAEQAGDVLPELRRIRPAGLVRQFARSMRMELDLRVEARNTERLRNLHPMDSGVVIPTVFGAWTTERMCVLEYLEGPSVSDWLQGTTEGPKPRHIADVGSNAMLRMIFVDGVFHADPHPGNLILLPSGDVGLIDFGMVGYLAASRREEFLALLMSAVSSDVDEAVDVLLGWSDGSASGEALSQECSEFLDRYHGLPLSEIDTRELLGDLLRLLRENEIVLPQDVALLLKVCLTLDDLGRSLDPDFVLTDKLEPFVRRAWRQQHSMRAVLARGRKELGSIFSSLPRDLRHLALWARHGHLRVEVDLDRLEDFGRRVDHSVNRLTVGLIASALIIGTSISMTVPGGAQLLGFPLFGFLAFTGSLAAGVFLLWTILRSGGG